MANIPLDENLASVLVAAQYVLGYRYTYSQNWDVTIQPFIIMMIDIDKKHP